MIRRSIFSLFKLSLSSMNLKKPEPRSLGERKERGRRKEASEKKPWSFRREEEEREARERDGREKREKKKKLTWVRERTRVDQWGGG